MKRRRALATLGLVGSGGCLRLTGGSEKSTSRTGTDTATTQRRTGDTTTRRTGDTTTRSTESTSRTETQTSSDLTYPSGLSAEGIREYFISSHLSTLKEASFVAEWSKFDRFSSRFKWRKRYESDVDQAVGRATTRGVGNGPADVYRRAVGGSFWRENMGSEYTYGQEDERMKMSEIAWGDEIVPLVRAGEWSAPERVNDSRPAVWEVTTDSVDGEPDAPGYFSGVTLSISASMRIDERGFISELIGIYDIRKSDERGGDTRGFTTEFTVDGFGQTSVSEPSWVATARDRRPQISAEVVEDGMYVRLNHDGGSRLEPSTRVVLFDSALDGANFHRLKTGIEAGETVYFYRTDDAESSNPMGISRGNPPAEGPSSTFKNPGTIGARRATLYYFKTPL